MTQPRRIIPGQFYLVTRRTLLRTFLLRPDHVVNQAFEYCMAEAAAHCGIDLIAWCAMSNHYHAIIYDPDGRVPVFIERLHRNIAKVLLVHRGRAEGIWSREQTCLTRLVTLNDVFDKVVYVLSNPASAHLVDDIVHWPGSSSWDRMGRDPKVVQRPTAYFQEDGRMPATVELCSVAPNGLDRKTYEDWIKKVRDAVQKRQEKLAKKRHEQGISVLGRKRVLKTDPLATPTSESSRGKLSPHLACKDKKRMREEQRILKDFRADYRTMRIRLRTEGAGEVILTASRDLLNFESGGELMATRPRASRQRPWVERRTRHTA